MTLRLEAVAVAAAQVTNLVEKRLHRVLDARFSGLPETFLAAERLGAMLDNLEAALACEFVALRQAAHLRGDEFVALRQAAHLRGDELDAPLLAGALARLAEIVAPVRMRDLTRRGRSRPGDGDLMASTI